MMFKMQILLVASSFMLPNVTYGMLKQLARPLLIGSRFRAPVHRWITTTSAEEINCCKKRIERLQAQFYAEYWAHSFLVAGIRLDDYATFIKLKAVHEKRCKDLNDQLSREHEQLAKYEKR